MLFNRTLLTALFLLASVTAASGLATAAEPSLNEVYQAAQSGHLKQAEAMMDQVLRDHPNSAKAHYVQAELLAKEGRVDLAKAELATAERLAPGLAFAKPEAVRELQARLAPRSASLPPAHQASQAAAAPAPDVPWGYWLLGGLVVAAFVFFVRSLMQQRSGPAPGFGAPAAYGPGAAAGTMGAGGVTPMGSMGPMAAPGGGIGSGMLGGLATGVAVGAGVVAGEALMHRVLGGSDSHRTDAQPALQPFDDAGLSNDNMGGAGFGIADSGSWDDAAGGDGGGGDWG